MIWSEVTSSQRMTCWPSTVDDSYPPGLIRERNGMPAPVLGGSTTVYEPSSTSVGEPKRFPVRPTEYPTFPETFPGKETVVRWRLSEALSEELAALTTVPLSYLNRNALMGT